MECDTENCEKEYVVELVWYGIGESGNIREDRQVCVDCALEFLFKKKVEQANEAVVYLEKMTTEVTRIKKDMTSLHKIAAKIGVVSCNGVR